MTGESLAAVASWIAAQQPSTTPLFSNDLGGFIKILSIILVTVLLPLGGLIVYFLKSGTTRQIDALKAGTEQSLTAMKAAADAQVAILTQQLNGYGGRLNTDEENLRLVVSSVSGIRQTVHESARETLDAFRTSAEAIRETVNNTGRANLEASHTLDNRLGRLEERADIAGPIKDICGSIEKLAAAVIARDGTTRGK